MQLRFSTCINFIVLDSNINDVLIMYVYKIYHVYFEKCMTKEEGENYIHVNIR